MKHNRFQFYQISKVINYFSQCGEIHIHRSSEYLRFTDSFVDWKALSILQNIKQQKEVAYLQRFHLQVYILHLIG